MSTRRIIIKIDLMAAAQIKELLPFPSSISLFVDAFYKKIKPQENIELDNSCQSCLFMLWASQLRKGQCVQLA